jgi:hypothetical protein
VPYVCPMRASISTLVLAAGLLMPAAAAASEPSTVAYDATTQGSIFRVGAAPGDVMVQEDLPPFEMTFQNARNPLEAGFGCSPGAPAVCPPGPVTIHLGDGFDRAVVLTVVAPVTIYGYGGDDELRAAAIREVVHAGAGDDTVFARSRVATVYGDGGADRLYGAELLLHLNGGDGNDLVVSDGAFGDLTGGDGYDVIVRGGAGEAGLLDGGEDPDLIGFLPDYGNDSSSWTLVGGGSYDAIHGSPGTDSVSGGPGNDEIWVHGGGADSVDCGGGFDEVNADGSDAVAANCERVRLNAGPVDRRFARALAQAADLRLRG